MPSAPRDKLAGFLETGIASALDYSLLSEAELLEDVTVATLVKCLEGPMRARLLAACLKAETVDPELVIRCVGIEELCHSAPPSALWKAFERAGRRASLAAPEMVVAEKRAPRVVPEPEPEPARRVVSANVVSRRRAEAHAAVSPEARAEGSAPRKPNRRVAGAGATSRRSASPVSDAMFVSSRHRSSARAATEPAAPPEHDSDVAEIEVIDETEVELPLDRKS